MAEIRISATELARSIGDILGRLRYRGESFIVEKNGTPIAILTPYTEGTGLGVRKVLQAWMDACEPDEEFATLLDEVGRRDAPLENPWASQ